MRQEQFGSEEKGNGAEEDDWRNGIAGALSVRNNSVYIHTPLSYTTNKPPLNSIIQFWSIFLVRWEVTSHRLAPGMLLGYGRVLMSAAGTQHRCIHPGTITETG